MQRNNKKGKRGIKRILNASKYSIEGIIAAYKDEEAFRQILLTSIILIPLAIIIGDNWIEIMILIIPCVITIIAELANSAIENAIDFCSLEIHPLAKKAKDMGSAMQLISCILLGAVWISYLVKVFVLEL